MNNNEKSVYENKNKISKDFVRESDSELPNIFTNRQKDQLNFNTDIQVKSEIPISI